MVLWFILIPEFTIITKVVKKPIISKEGGALKTKP